MSAEVEGALRAGKFPAHRAPHYETLMAADPVGTRQLLGSMASVVPMSEAGGVPVAATAAPAADSSYPTEWLAPGDRKPKTELGGKVVFGND